MSVSVQVAPKKEIKKFIRNNIIGKSSLVRKSNPHSVIGKLKNVL